ncbi:MAG: bifunctional adenosylcobinamide kinase/adenosylcobinamide-phosphate guanylyltransferase [Bacilli bacterium]
MIFVSGGVRSGKSSFAEELVLNCDGDYIYIATAKNYDDEMDLRIRKHQEDRRNKGFRTIEATSNLSEIYNILKANDIVLLECLTTLVANEMFDNNLTTNEVVSKVRADIMTINNKVRKLIIVSNDLYGDDISYDKSVNDYYEAVVRISSIIIGISQEVYEMSYGIAIKRK